MSTTVTVGDRFEDKDPRSEGRIVEVREIGGNRFGDSTPYAKVQVEVHPTNPTAVGRHSWVKLSALTTRFRKVSH